MIDTLKFRFSFPSKFFFLSFFLECLSIHRTFLYRGLRNAATREWVILVEKSEYYYTENMCNSVRVDQLLCRGKTRIWFDLIICPDNEIGSVGERGDENPRWRDQPIGRVGNFEFGSEQDNLVAGRPKLVEKFARIGSERERYKRDVRYQIVGTVAVVEGSLPVEEPVVGVGRIDKPQPRDTGRKPMRYIYIYISPSLKYNFSPLKIKNPKNLSM